MLVKGEILQDRKVLSVEALLDTGAEVNIISQQYIIAHELEQIDGDLPTPQTFNSISIYCYGAYQLECRFTDSWGMTKVKAHTFYALKKKGEPLILGMPALDLEQAVIDMHVRSWRFGIEKPSFIVKELEEFALSLLNKSAVYALMVSGITGALAEEQEAKEVPKEYADYTDIFSIKEAGRLPEHKNNNHAINLIEGGDPPHRSLYNLLRPELKVLREYLDNTLAKRWIRHSVSLVRAPILFVLKKDESLQLCVDYQDLNKMTIRNRHSLPLISETLD